MRHQEIVKLLREIDDYAKAGAGVPIRMWRCAGEVADAVEQMENEITRLREERRWIPVGERLPEVGSSVLVAWRYGEEKKQAVSQAWYDPVGNFMSLEDMEFPSVTHWHPMPAPPKGGEVEE